MKSLQPICLFFLALLLVLNSCAKSSSDPTSSGDGSDLPSSGTGEVIINSTNNITGPEISCADGECTAKIEWE